MPAAPLLAAVLPLLPLTFLAPDVAELKQILERHERDPYEQRERTRAIRDLGRIGSAESTRALEALLDDPFAHVRDAAVSALIALKRQPADRRAPSLEMLGEALGRRRRPETRRHLATALGLIGDRAAVPELADALRREKNPDVTGALAQALSRLQDERAIPVLKDKAEKRPAARAACLRALGWFPNTAGFASGHRDDDSDDVKAAVVEVLARRGKPVLPEHEVTDADGERFGIALAETLPSMRDPALRRRRAGALLRHPSWRVRAAAIDGVVAVRDPVLVADLVERMASEPGRLRGDAWNALRALTGREIGPDPELWKALLPLETLPEEGAERKAHGMKATAAYFEIPVYSRRIAFVFDVSGSMRDDGKMEKARAQCAATLAKLDDDQRYDLFVYRYLLDYPPRPKLERAFGKLIAGRTRRAVRWLKRQPAKGGGAIYDGLVAAMDDPDVDTIFLLSDGVPSYGTVSRDFRVRQEVRRHNRWRRVAIHTVLLGTRGTDRRFMKRLASENGGIAVDGSGRPLR